MITTVNLPQLSRTSKKSSAVNLLVLGFFVLLCCWWGGRQVKSVLTEPQAIVVLGGHEEREHLAAKLAMQHPNIPIWVSSGSPTLYVEKIFRKAGINLNRLHLDYRAKDTVTNFTTLVDELKAKGIENVYLVTSENHMRRSYLVGEIIFGSRNIVTRPVSVKSQTQTESLGKSLRDSVRAIWWLMTGSTGRV